MACRLHFTAVSWFDSYRSDFVAEYRMGIKPRLPKVAKPFWRQSVSWRENFLACYTRIACRLQKGLEPHPNCTGEEIAFHDILRLAVDSDEILCDTWTGQPSAFDRLPVYPNDDNFSLVGSLAVQDEDVLMLFDGEGAYSSSDEEDEPQLGKRALFALGLDGNPASSMMDCAKL
jgi:hypothetical protein